MIWLWQVYLMYAFARIQSIFGKAGVTGEDREKLIRSGVAPAMAEVRFLILSHIIVFKFRVSE